MWEDWLELPSPLLVANAQFQRQKGLKTSKQIKWKRANISKNE